MHGVASFQIEVATRVGSASLTSASFAVFEGATRPWTAARSQLTAEIQGPDALVRLDRSDGPRSVDVTLVENPLPDRLKIGCDVRGTRSLRPSPSYGNYNRPVVAVAPVHATANPPIVGGSSSSSPPSWAGVASTIGISVRCRKEKPPYFIREVSDQGHSFRSSPDGCLTPLLMTPRRWKLIHVSASFLHGVDPLYRCLGHLRQRRGSTETTRLALRAAQ